MGVSFFFFNLKMRKKILLEKSVWPTNIGILLNSKRGLCV